MARRSDAEAYTYAVEMVARALHFHERRDQMNATLHLSAVRWSPLTLALRSALVVLEERDEREEETA